MPQRRTLRFETLESRQVLATAGLPWPAPERLTLSFAPDGTRIGHFESDLYGYLGAHRDALEWQTQLLRAFATWTAEADLDIGVVRDGGQAFTAAGLIQGDPRFGSIRIGAFPQRRALANAVPYLPAAGSWSGDVFLNSAAEAGLRDPRVDLFTVLLNEAGNVLGLADNLDSASAMHSDYLAPRAGLSASDIDAIRGLYGSRQADSWEGATANDSIVTAAALGSTSSLAGAPSMQIDAELSTIGDSDHYRFDAEDILGPVIVRVRTAGLSLLVPRVTVIDAAGEVVASAAAANPLANNVEVTIHRPRGGASYVIRIEGTSSDVFAVGRYELEIVTRERASNLPAGAAPSPGGGLAPFDFVDDELGENDSPATATPLTTAWGYSPGTRYEAVGAVRTTTDVDVYRVVSPPDDASTALVHIETLDHHPISVQIEVRTTAGDLLGSRTITSGDDDLPSLEINNLSPGETYFVSVASDGRGRDIGTYVLIVDFVDSGPNVEVITSGTLSAVEAHQSRYFVIPRTQLFVFELSAVSIADAVDGRVEMSILDEQERMVSTATAARGQTDRVYVWLTAGAYRFLFSRLEGTDGDSISYELRGAGLSDDTGPGWIDPTEAPLPGDADRNGTVDRGDVRVVASQFTQLTGSLIAAADLDADGDVDLADLAVVMWNLGRSLVPTSTSQPLVSWASAAVSTTSADVRTDATVLRVSDWRPVLVHSRVGGGRRLHTGHAVREPQAKPNAPLSIKARRLAAVDRALMTAID